MESFRRWPILPNPGLSLLSSHPGEAELCGPARRWLFWRTRRAPPAAAATSAAAAEEPENRHRQGEESFRLDLILCSPPTNMEAL